ncbi:MAG: 2-oxoacid:acceptor oxidoreductase subunit alpha [bacterium]|nr:2-oxoacid:acceptor oxidoreductase subunit alpha [bacterium]
MIDLQWLIGGEAGYGIMTTGLMMSKIFTRLGLHVFDYVEYPSLIRGGHNAYYVRASDEEVTSQKKTVDILVALNADTIKLHVDELSPNAAVIFDPSVLKLTVEQFPVSVRLFPVPLLELTKKVGADRLMINTVSVGASLALFHKQFDVLQKIMQDTFGKKGDDVVALNNNTSKAGYDYVVENFGPGLLADIPIGSQTRLLIGGAEAIAFGAIRAGLKFAAMYPMTPINTIMTTLVAHALKYNIVVKEPEDEIAGINMALGASFAGARSMVATSGGGFSLMVEGLGLAAQTETPIVVVLGMRPGPATGMPTWSDQGDLRFALHAAQGDFPRIILAPGDMLDAFEGTMTALNLAEKYQLPVIVLVDKHINESHATVESEKLKVISDTFVVERGKILTDQEALAETDYKRYALVEDGISPRSLPGQQGGIGLSGSDEHDEKGLYNEEADMRIKMMDKRYAKLAKAIANNEFPAPRLIGDPDAALTIVAFGSTKFAILDAMRQLKKENISVNFLQVSFLEPFPSQAFTEMIGKTKKTLIVEANKTGQFEGLIRERTGITFEHHLRKYDGRPFYPEEIIEKVKALQV